MSLPTEFTFQWGTGTINKQSFTSGYVQGTRNIEMKGCGPWLRESRGLLGKMEKKGDVVNCLSRGMDKKVTMKRRE